MSASLGTPTRGASHRIASHRFLHISRREQTSVGSSLDLDSYSHDSPEDTDIMEVGGYNDSNRAFLQAFMARSTMTFEEAQPVLAAILSAHRAHISLLLDHYLMIPTPEC